MPYKVRHNLHYTCETRTSTVRILSISVESELETDLIVGRQCASETIGWEQLVPENKYLSIIGWEQLVPKNKYFINAV